MTMPPQALPLRQGFADFITEITEDAMASDLRTQAITQIVNLDPRQDRVLQDNKLVIRCTRLQDRRFFDSCVISRDSTSADIKRILGHWSFVSSTGILIGPKHVLMAGHCVIEKRLDETYFIFGRTPDSPIAEPDSDGNLRLPLDAVRQAVRVVEIVNPTPSDNRVLQPDWAIVEIDRPVTIKPFPVKKPNTYNHKLQVFSHPFGVPMQRSTATVMATTPELRLGRLACDFGSGGSGSPLFDRDLMVGVVSGNARFHVSHRVGSRIVVPSIPQHPTLDQTQPTTLAAEILANSSVQSQ